MHKILSVDDEPINQAIVEELFSPQFEVALLSSGEECLSQIEAIRPELILLDVSMPGIDGYQTCCELKANESTRHIPIVFVSARSTLEDKIKGYEAGGQDYITKPFKHSELEVRIKQLIESGWQSRVDIEPKNRPTERFTPSIMNVSGDSDIALQFFDVSSNCHTLDELGKMLLKTCEQLHLDCVIQFHCDPGSYNFSNKEISPLELSLIEETLDKGRFFEFNTGMVVNFPHLSLLVKNMPKGDEQRYDQVKVMLETFLSGVESTLKALI